MPEFTGKSREIYRVHVTMERQRQIQHATEGWINLPGSKPEMLHAETVAATDSEPQAKFAFDKLTRDKLTW